MYQTPEAMSANPNTIRIMGVDITANENGMYNLNHIWRGCNLPENKRPSQWRDDTRVALESSANLHSFTGSGTWGTKTGVYAYSMWVDTDFYLTVVACFEAAANGDVNKAGDIAASVVVCDTLIGRITTVSLT